MIKQFLTLAFLASAFVASAQAYKGKGDKKAQVAASFQSGGAGIHGSGDFGLGENFSMGFTVTYLLDADGEFNYNYDNIFFPTLVEDEPDFYEKFDAKLRFNANLGSVIGLPSSMDLYPGLNIGIHNFGTHVGFRYFFTDGFGVFTEAGIPITKYEGNTYGNENYHNQFVFNIGASFNL